MPELDAEKELRDNRFSYLLQPIRDLAANWDINIAGELEEYLDELEHLTFTIEGCGPALNFAEAALLIQGTTCVFSKKVEYLHNLVYQALETIFNKKQKERQAAANKSKASRPADGVAADGLDDAEAFFSLGDNLELAAQADINLGDEDETAPPELLRPPTALLALEDAACGQGGQQPGTRSEVGSYRLAQCSVHVSGALLLEGRDGQLYDEYLRPVRGGSSKANSTWGASAGLGAAREAGAFLSDVTDGLSAEGQAAGAGSDFGTTAAVCEPAGEEVAFEAAGYDDAGHEGYGDDDEGVVQHAHDVAAAGAAAGDAEMTDVDMQQLQQQQMEAGEAVVRCEEPPDWLSQPAALDADGQQQDAEDHVAAVADAAADGAAAGEEAAAEDAAGGRVRQQRGRSRQAGEGPAGYYDPYQPLDPAEPGNLPIKPLQVRKPKRRASTAALHQGDAATSTSTAYLTASRHPHLAWPEFGYLLDRLAVAAAAARISSRRRGDHQQQQQSSLVAVGPQVAAVMDWQDAEAAQQREQEVLMMEQEDEEAGTAAGAFGDDGYEDDYAPDAGGADLLDDANMLEAAGQEGLVGGLRPWATAGAGAGAGGLVPDWMAGGGPAGEGGEATYEELCRSHIESLIAAAAAQQVQSGLAVRVSTWRSRIDPILAAEEDRSAFDIHDYGTQILDRLAAASQPSKPDGPGGGGAVQQEQEQRAAAAALAADSGAVDFQQVAHAADSFEVCRMFAAMLQLVNNRNINLVKQSDPGQDEASSSSSSEGTACSSLQLQLLSVARVHEAMAEGLAGGDTSLPVCNGPLDAPPPRGKPAAKKGKGTKAAAPAGDGGEGHATGKGSKSSKVKPAARSSKKKGANSSSEGDDGSGHISEISDSDEEFGLPPAATAGRKGAARGRAAAGRAGKAAAAADDGGDGDGDDAASSEELFDADAENQGVRAGAAAAKGGKGGKPPAKKAKRLGTAAVV